MAAEDATFQMDSGSPEQLPQGAASELNASLPTEGPITAPAAEGAAPAEEAAAPVLEPADPNALRYSPQDDDERFLTDPSLYPDEPITAGTGRRNIPPEVLRNLPLLVQAAQAPGASVELQTLVSLILAEVNA